MKTRIGNVCLFAVFGLGLAVACGGGSSSQDVNPIVPSDGGGMVSYAQNVQPIFTATCATAGCHSGPTVPASGNLDLSAGVSYANLVNHESSPGCESQVPNVLRVKPGDTAGSMLFRKVAADPSRCSAPMPFGTSGLIHTAPNAFNTIEQWIEQGALNN
jgi:hypothetical protein